MNIVHKEPLGPRRALAGFYSVAVLLLATAFAAVLVLYLTEPAVAGQSGEGQEAGVRASTRMNAETFARADNLQKSEFHSETVDGTNGVATSSYKYPPPAPDPNTIFTCPEDGCAGFTGRAHGHADARGALEAYASARMYIGNPPNDGYGMAGYISSDGHAAIDDTITLSEPATVVLRGNIEGKHGGYNSHYESQGNDPDAVLDASLRFSREKPFDPFDPDYEEVPWEDLGGFSEEYQAQIYHCLGDTCAVSPETGPQLTTVDDSFSVTVDLPAGTSDFDAVMYASIDYQVYGESEDIVSKNALLDFANTLDFEIEVPEGVTATSGSGLLPIVGGTQSTDTTAPATTATSVPEPNAAGWHREDVTVNLAATDNEGGSGVEEITYSVNGGQPVTVQGDAAQVNVTTEGETTITYSARDNAGNTEQQKTFTVRLDETAPVLGLSDVTVDATSPEGAKVSYSASATDNLDPNPGVSCTPSSGSTFSIGTTTVNCVATDVAGNSASGSFQVTVKGAAEQLSDLVAVVQSLSIDQGTRNSLLAKLQNAQKQVKAGNKEAPCGQLGAFINHVEAQSGKKLTVGQANDLIEAASRIRAVLSCP